MNPFHSVVSGAWTHADAAKTGRDASVPLVGVMAKASFFEQVTAAFDALGRYAYCAPFDRAHALYHSGLTVSFAESVRSAANSVNTLR